MSDEATRPGKSSSTRQKRPHEREVLLAAVERIKKVPKLWRQYERLLEAMNTGTTEDLASKHAIGTIVHEVRSGPAGRSSVKLLATVMGEHVSLFYEAADLVAAFTADRIEEISARSNIYGRRISYTILLLLSRVKNLTRREHLLERVINEGLSTRELAALIDPGAISVTTDDPVVVVRRATRSVQLLSRHTAGLADAFRALPDDDVVRRDFIAARADLEQFMTETAGLVAGSGDGPTWGGQRGDA